MRLIKNDKVPYDMKQKTHSRYILIYPVEGARLSNIRPNMAKYC